MNDFDFFWPKNSIKMIKNDTKNVIFKSKIDQNKYILLENLKKKMLNIDNISFKNQATNFVFGDGDIDSEILFVGEAPGEEEDLKGLPFVGKSGKLLRFFLKEVNFKKFYITNVIPWRPPQNRTPTKEEIEKLRPFLLEHIKIIDPKIIVSVGSSALKALNIEKSITSVQGTFIETEIGKIYPIYHPSYALRVIDKKKDLWKSLIKLRYFL